MRVLFVLFLLFPFYQSDTDSIYGSYRMPERSMILELSAPEDYTLFVVEQDKSGMVTSKEVSRGTFTREGNNVNLSGQMNKSHMVLTVLDGNKLEVNSLLDLQPKAEFLQYSGYYESGKVKFEGSWKKGRKHGLWVYYDEEGNVQKRETYKRGKLKN